MINAEDNLVWNACGAAVFLLLTVIHRWSRGKGMLVAALWNLSGVILHEVAHLLAGLLFRAQPVGFSLVPRRRCNGWVLGSVVFRKITALNAVPVALAPLGLVFVAYVVWQSWGLWFEPALSTTIWLFVLMFILLYNAAPSLQDLKVACNWKSLLLYGSGVFIGYWFLYGN